MDDDHPSVRQLNVREKALVAAKDAPVGQRRQQQGRPSVQGEVGERPVVEGLASDHRDGRLGWTHPQPVLELPHRLGLPADQDLHLTVGQIAGVARHPQPHGLLPRGGPEKHTLYPPAHLAAEADTVFLL